MVRLTGGSPGSKMPGLDAFEGFFGPTSGRPNYNRERR